MDGTKKRKLAASGPLHATKRTKTSSVKPKVKTRTQTQTQTKTKQSKRLVGLDALPWSKAALPEMFDDAEGFYGLEEVEGVEVVRGSGDSVGFRAAVAADSEPESASEIDNDEFEGFDDEPTSAAVESTAVSKPVPDKSAVEPKKEKEKTKNKKKDKARDKFKDQTEGDSKDKVKDQTQDRKKDRKKSGVREDSELEANVFAGLDAADTAQDELDLSEWAKLDLSAGVLSSLARLKFSTPTAIQAAAIPDILAGHDVIGKASTGSGKTLAFGIPIVERWLELADRDTAETASKAPIALILSPTRELAHQLTDHIKNLCSGLADSPYICSITGGLAVQKQQRQLAKADIVIGTPGRLWEVLSSSTETMSSFRRIRYLVIDEADRLLTEGHFKEAEDILTALDRVEMDEENDGDDTELSPRQTLVFSATFHKGLQQKLAGKGKMNLMSQEDSMEYLLKKLNFREESPKFIDVNPVSQMAEGLKEGLVECGAMEKDLYLYALLLLYPNVRTLVFTNSISAARRISPMLQNLNLTSHALHSQMAQKARLRSIERFTTTQAGQSSVLIATDVAARGLDIPNVDLVVHYHVPRDAAAYVHRSGRTARADKTGLSILLCAPEEVIPTRRLIAKVHSERKVSRKNFFVQTLDVDRKLVSRLKPRITLAKKIADVALAKEKGNKDDEWMRNAAEELGVEYDDSDDLDLAGNWGGRGGGRKKKQQEARGTTKAELGAMRAELRALLARRVNAGVSERYIANGTVDVDELLRGANGDFLGRVEGLDIAAL
ncbi:ATP-dependent RNA helicase MAK5 [Nemania sp. FL0916]|nr:ATP-dependent RNA helicase MAK5 [Nemania sp. FL0916]